MATNGTRRKKKKIKALSTIKTPPDYNILLVICVQMFNLPYAHKIAFESSHAAIATSRWDMLTWHPFSIARA
jgi:hypothetical protein